jgi:F420-dependent oxidoreductase-like protein
MRISIYGGSDATTVDEVVARVGAAAREGFPAFWLPQTAGLDALTALAIAAREVPAIGLGTAVVPVQGRHPIPLAQQTLTLADAAGAGRVTLGIGVTHKPVSEGWYGIPYRSVVQLCDETLRVLDGLLGQSRRADVDGDYVHAHIELPLAVARPGLVVAALGPKMLELAGRHADGTVTWMTGVSTLRKDVVPRLRSAAEAAARPEPRVVVGLPVCVTDDAAGARGRIAPGMAGTARMASYARMIASEGVSDAVDIALIGNEDDVAQRIDALVQAGMTELCANVLGDADERARTRTFLASLNASPS